MHEQPAFRWVIVVVAALMLALIMGQIVNGLAVYLVPLETAQGWDRGAVAGINSAGLLGLASGGLFLGRLADRFGARVMAPAGIAVAGTAMAAASGASALWQLYLGFFVAGFAAGGAVYAPMMALVGNWFTRGAGLAIGIVAAGQAMGQGLVPFTGAHLIEAYGWRGALLAQGLGTVAILLPLTLLLRPAPRPAPVEAAAPAQGQEGFPIPEWQVVALIGGAGFLCCVCMSVPLIHLVPLIQGCGFTAPQAGGVLLFTLGIAIFGRVFFGWLADRLGALPAWMIASAWQTALIFGFTLMATLQGFYLYAAIYAFGYGGVMTGVLTTTRALTPPHARARVNGLVMAFTFSGHGFGGYQGGLFYDLTGGYGWSFANGALAGLGNLALLLTLYLLVHRRPARTAPA